MPGLTKDSPQDFTEELLHTAAELLPQVYNELRRMAAQQLAIEPGENTLQATALVHEAWLRVDAGRASGWQNRQQFLLAAAQAMRWIMVDRARRRQALRHGGGKQRVDIADVDVSSPEDDAHLLAMHDALDRLTAESPKKGELVRLRYFVGASVEEAADLLGISVQTAHRWWAFSRAWLRLEIENSQTADSPTD